MHTAVSRTDSIGDVLMTLPFVAFLRKKYPSAKISFIAKPYTFPVLKATKIIDNIITPAEMDSSITHLFLVFPRFSIAKKAFFLRIPNRIGTSRRIYNLIFCNKLVNFSRKNSDLNEAQLNFFLYKAIEKDFNIPDLNTIREIVQNDVRLTPYVPLPGDVKKLTEKYDRIVILHLKSQGSAREYPLQLWEKIIPELYKINNTGFFFTGTHKEYLLIKDFIDKYSRENIHNLTGKLNLAEFITFIDSSDLLIANSTGPLHIASFLQKNTIGLFPTLKNISPTRWEPVGKPSTILTANKKCYECSLKKTGKCNCMWEIPPGLILEKIYAYVKY